MITRLTPRKADPFWLCWVLILILSTVVVVVARAQQEQDSDKLEALTTTGLTHNAKHNNDNDTKHDNDQVQQQQQQQQQNDGIENYFLRPVLVFRNLSEAHEDEDYEYNNKKEEFSHEQPETVSKRNEMTTEYDENKDNDNDDSDSDGNQYDIGQVLDTVPLDDEAFVVNITTNKENDEEEEEEEDGSIKENQTEALKKEPTAKQGDKQHLILKKQGQATSPKGQVDSENVKDQESSVEQKWKKSKENPNADQEKSLLMTLPTLNLDDDPSFENAKEETPEAKKEEEEEEDTVTAAAVVSEIKKETTTKDNETVPETLNELMSNNNQGGREAVVDKVSSTNEKPDTAKSDSAADPKTDESTAASFDTKETNHTKEEVTFQMPVCGRIWGLYYNTNNNNNKNKRQQPRADMVTLFLLFQDLWGGRGDTAQQQVAQLLQKLEKNQEEPVNAQAMEKQANTLKETPPLGPIGEHFLQSEQDPKSGRVGSSRVSGSGSGSVNDNYNEFVDGLDDIGKFFEDVDPPDELDIGAGGFSLQEVVVGRGSQILRKRLLMALKTSWYVTVDFSQAMWHNIRQHVQDWRPLTKLSMMETAQGAWNKTRHCLGHSKDWMSRILFFFLEGEDPDEPEFPYQPVGTSLDRDRQEEEQQQQPGQL